MIFDNLTDDVKSAIPEEYLSDPVFTEVPDFNTLLKNYKESKSYTGKLNTQLADSNSQLTNSIRMPTDNASPDALAQVYADIISKAPNLMMKPTDEAGFSDIFKQLGMPDDHSGYKFPEIEGVTVDDDRKKMLMELAHKNNFTAKQFEGMAGQMLEADKKVMDAQQFAKDGELTSLKEKWGQAYGDNMNAALGAFNSASDTRTDTLNPAMAQVFHALSQQIKTQSSQMDNQIGSTRHALTPAEANMQMREAMNNKDHIINQPGSPERDQYLATTWTDLHAAINGE